MSAQSIVRGRAERLRRRQRVMNRRGDRVRRFIAATTTSRGGVSPVRSSSREALPPAPRIHPALLGDVASTFLPSVPTIPPQAFPVKPAILAARQLLTLGLDGSRPGSPIELRGSEWSEHPTVAAGRALGPCVRAPCFSSAWVVGSPLASSRPRPAQYLCSRVQGTTPPAPAPSRSRSAT